MTDCVHIGEVHEVTPQSDGCEECRRADDPWVHLRMCLKCGNVGCCDSSKNRHATKHHAATGHPIAASLERGEDWAWCFADGVLLEIES